MSSSSSQSRVPSLLQTNSGRADSPITVASLGESTFRILASCGEANCSCAKKHPFPEIEVRPGVWFYDSTITDINKLHKQCVEKGVILASESVSAIVGGHWVELDPFNSQPHPCEIEGCGCEEGSNVGMTSEDDDEEEDEEEDKSANDAGDEKTD